MKEKKPTTLKIIIHICPGLVLLQLPLLLAAYRDTMLGWMDFVLS